MKEAEFIGNEVKELLLRPYKVNADRLRPQDRMVAHTGYLGLARAPHHLPSLRRTAGELARLSREDLLAWLIQLLRGFMVGKAQRQHTHRRVRYD